MAEPALGDAQRPLRVAIVGSGPSAFYAAEALFKADGSNVRVDMFDRLPTPYGLVRGGVAPDHQKIKSVVKVYEKISANEGFRFFGNVKLGRDIAVTDLQAHYDQIVYAVGNESDRKMGVDGEDLEGVHSATEFVGWYNGHPDYRDLEFKLATAQRVAVVGNGNVAIDVARILVRKPDELAETDIADYALSQLRASSVEEVMLLGRRGPAQAAFSPKEIQELADLDGVDVVVSTDEAQLDELSATWLEDQPRSAKRNVEFLQEQAGEGAGSNARRVVCRFLVSPTEFGGDGSAVSSVKVERGELHADSRGTPRPKGTGEFEDLDVQLVFKAVGYRGVPIEGVPFDDGWGVIPNDEGRVLDARDGNRVDGQYVVGWAKRGPTGLIGTNSPDAKETVARMLEDIAGKTAAALAADDADAMPSLLAERGVEFVTLEDWQRLDAFERDQGQKAGKVRAKLTSIDEMMKVVRDLRSTVS